jgi:hypothetical protein
VHPSRLAPANVALGGSGEPASQFSSPDELPCSDRDAEGPQERGQLRRDAVDGTRDDSEDGVKEAADDGNSTKHEKHFAFRGQMVEGVMYRPHQKTLFRKRRARTRTFDASCSQELRTDAALPHDGACAMVPSASSRGLTGSGQAARAARDGRPSPRARQPMRPATTISCAITLATTPCRCKEMRVLEVGTG